jgi:hypothetical protein
MFLSNLTTGSQTRTTVARGKPALMTLHPSVPTTAMTTFQVRVRCQTHVGAVTSQNLLRPMHNVRILQPSYTTTILMSTSTRVYASLLLSLCFSLRYPGSESRKRTPLPPQSEAFRPGSRLGTLQRDSGYTSSGLAAPAQASAPPREIRSANRAAPSDGPRDTTRHTPSPTVPQVDLPTAERSDRARSRRSKSSANGPMHMDSYFPPESTRDRDRDVAMDVDDAPPPRSSDPPPRHSLPKRPVTQDEVPRYPRAMLGADGDGTLRGRVIFS